MTENEKLLEAARMIKEHCKETEFGKPCCFGLRGVCFGADDCAICFDETGPVCWCLDNKGDEQ